MKIIVIGAGAAGLVAAANAAQRSADVLLLEKNNKTGVKILMSGGTRCNVTQHTDAQGITAAFGNAKRFLQPSVGAFSPADVVQMFNHAGVPTKVESTGKVFPVSDRALHVRDALHGLAVDAGAKIQLGASVIGIKRSQQSWSVETPTGTIDADRVILTAGGKSWPGCGTTGDAYGWLRELGHTIVPPRPALVPLVGGQEWTHDLSGLTLEDCEASVYPREGKKKDLLAARRGSWLFTHFGFSGPAAMDVSGVMTAAESFRDVRLSLDLVPTLTDADLHDALGDRSGDGGRQRISSVLGRWLPNRLAAALVQQVGSDDTIAQLTRPALRQLVEQIKRLPVRVTGTRGFDKAEVTAGGVHLNEIDAKTMESRIAAGLFIAGEVLDVDGPIGGYNFQAAFSTGRAAGIAAASA
jgi:predicted Rossmann fold flavoprotein